MAVVLVNRVNGRLVFRCDESNETFMAHPNSTAAVLLSSFRDLGLGCTVKAIYVSD
jgi:hypothetical protein